MSTNTSHSDLNQPAASPELWQLDREITFLNHGSFGSCPQALLEYQRALVDRLERQPISFFVHELEGLVDNARATLAQFVGASPDDLVFVPNATAGVNTVLRSLEFRPGDELLVTNQEYNACRNALDFVAERTGARVVVVDVPFPLVNPRGMIDAILERVSDKTRLALVDHVTSQTAMILPLAEIAAALRQRNVDLLVDGAHAPGMVPLNLEQLGATFYTGNCHKWLCAPKGAAFLYVQRDRQRKIRPLSISHGANSPRKDRSKFLIEFGWTGTSDPSAALTVPEAIRYIGALLPGGWPAVMERNRRLALEGRSVLCRALGIEPPCPGEMIGSLASVPLPDSTEVSPVTSPLYADPLQDRLREQHGIEVPIIPWPAPPKRLLRISAQLYNSLPQYELLAKALTELTT